MTPVQSAQLFDTPYGAEYNRSLIDGDASLTHNLPDGQAFYCKVGWMDSEHAETEVHENGIMHRTAEHEPRHSWRTRLIGRPLQTADAPHQTIGRAIGLAVFAPGAFSPTADAHPKILVNLGAPGRPAFGHAVPLSL